MVHPREELACVAAVGADAALAAAREEVERLRVTGAEQAVALPLREGKGNGTECRPGPAAGTLASKAACSTCSSTPSPTAGRPGRRRGCSSTRPRCAAGRTACRRRAERPGRAGAAGPPRTRSRRPGCPGRGSPGALTRVAPRRRERPRGSRRCCAASSWPHSALEGVGRTPEAGSNSELSIEELEDRCELLLPIDDLVFRRAVRGLNTVFGELPSHGEPSQSEVACALLSTPRRAATLGMSKRFRRLYALSSSLLRVSIFYFASTGEPQRSCLRYRLPLRSSRIASGVEK